ncbi:MAG: glycosyltransferase family 4 protein [Chloroflexota bacterium]|jgi:L-malate glycosyltransferase
MSGRVLHQFTEGVHTGDAVTDQVLLIQRWLRDVGFESDIFAEQIQPAFEGRVRFADDYRSVPAEQCLIHHHAVGSDVADRLGRLGRPQILIYHNITPAEYFATTNPVMAGQLGKGRRQLADMRSRTILALGDSGYNERELQELEFSATGVLPIVLDERQYDLPDNESLALECATSRPLLLFVGRQAPNKRQEDLIKLLYCVRRIEPEARLVLAGSPHVQSYVEWQRQLGSSLRLEDGAVHWAGHVSQQDMVTYYRHADFYVSMSEHEGFGKPLIESMYLGLPVVAYASTAVPDTLGDAGIQFYEKDYEALAELILLVQSDPQLRQRIKARQTRRVQSFLEPQVRRQWDTFLRQLGLLPGN